MTDNKDPQGWAMAGDTTGGWVPGVVCESVETGGCGLMLTIESMLPITRVALAESSMLADLMIMRVMMRETNS